MTQPSLAPSVGLTQPTQSIERPNRFILFTGSWLELQNYVATCLQLPISVQDFEKVYGTFPNKGLVLGTFDAMKKLRQLSADFGDPRILKSRIASEADYLFTAEPPPEIYSHIVWLALQMQNVASTFQFTFDNLRNAIGPGVGSAEERASNLKALLVGPAGLVSQADVMKGKTRALIKKLSVFEGRMADANEQMQHYSGQQTAVMQAANQLVGAYTHQIDDILTPACNAAWEKWRNYTIAAATSSVLLVIVGVAVFVFAPVTFGASTTVGTLLVVGGLAAGAALSAAAVQQRKAYNDLVGSIATATAEMKQKVQLVSDLTSLNSQILLIDKGFGTFRAALSEIEATWVQVGADLHYICSNYSVSQLSDLPWVTQAFKLDDARNKWRTIATTTRDFTEHSLVDYDIAHFGEPLPEPKAA